jgi:hypothetical protein
VAGGDGSSCAAALLAAAWQQCPQACQECGTTRVGCLAFSDDFIAFSQGAMKYMVQHICPAHSDMVSARAQGRSVVVTRLISLADEFTGLC